MLTASTRNRTGTTIVLANIVRFFPQCKVKMSLNLLVDWVLLGDPGPVYTNSQSPALTSPSPNQKRLSKNGTEFLLTVASCWAIMSPYRPKFTACSTAIAMHSRFATPRWSTSTMSSSVTSSTITCVPLSAGYPASEPRHQDQRYAAKDQQERCRANVGAQLAEDPCTDQACSYGDPDISKNVAHRRQRQAVRATRHCSVARLLGRHAGHPTPHGVRPSLAATRHSRSRVGASRLTPLLTRTRQSRPGQSQGPG